MTAQIPDDLWQFAIDVGGTFTDCIAVNPHSETQWCKVLSSGATKGKLVEVVANDSFRDPLRIGDGDQVWSGCELELFDARGRSLLQTRIDSFRSDLGEFRLAAGIDLNQPIAARNTGDVTYEIRGAGSAPLLAIRRILKAGLADALPPISVRLGTTRGTNALLTRRGARTALVTTRGFEDILAIGDQSRPELFKLAVRKPSPLYQRAIGIEERVLHDGTVRLPLDHDQVRAQLRELQATGIRSLAICLLHGFRYPSHEQRVAELARDIGFAEISLSSIVAPLIKMVPRGETTVMDAYLNPVLREYLADFARHLHPNSRLRLMTSAGGLVPPERFGGKESILSGPAGGVVGFSHVAQRCGFKRSIGFDMGGTSTDVARFDGSYERDYESHKAGIRIVSPMMAIETVAAGGGSICWFDGVRLRVGPDSAGADPGPACYGRGGPLTVTDLNVFLGRIVQQRFPFPLNHAAVTERLEALREEVNRQSGKGFSNLQLAEGLLQVAVSNISSAINTVSVARGFDPAGHVLVAYGGAASQHACRVADQLEMNVILSHPLAGILSAVGIQQAASSVHRSQSFQAELSNQRLPALERVFEKLTHEASIALRHEGVDAQQIQFRRLLDLRYRGTQSPMTVAGDRPEQLREKFLSRHEREFGYLMPRPIEICAARLEATNQSPDEPAIVRSVDRPRGSMREPLETAQRQQCVFAGSSRATALFDRAELSQGDRVRGPAIVYDDFSTAVIEPGWNAAVLEDGTLLVERTSDKNQRVGPGQDVSSSTAKAEEANPVQLEIFNNHFTSIARQMGQRLRRTAISVNVKERLDFSCAIFTRTGDLVVNAPHVPVHLGAMGETVRATIQLNEVISPGDMFVSNDPLRGGSHLPDITVVTPVFDEGGNEIVFFVASRCHHAEIGGVTSGSMPPDAKWLSEEGVLISNFKLIEAGQEQFERLREMLESGPYPSRAPEQNVADLIAQVAANQRGVNDLLKLIKQYSQDLVLRYMEYIQQAAESKTRLALRQMTDIETSFVDSLDCGARINARIIKQADQLTIDFTGTDPVLPNNLNANRAITTAAVLYCLRCLIDDDIPLNEGILRPVHLVLPACLINPPPTDDPQAAPAVAGGNVETSQRIVDVILGGLGVAAASQGTMNNLLIGDPSFSYYETICGGTGATPGHCGCDAVHSHMTNTRLTDPEVLESQFPIILSRFAIRQHSGGEGQFRGGNGVTREFEFLKPLEVSLITNRRSTRPFGMHGGRPGKSGVNLLFRAGSSAPRDLGHQCRVEIMPGDRIRIETPGGGGWCAPEVS